MEFTSLNCRGIWAGIQDKFSDREFGQGINKNFQDREIDRDYCKFLRRGNALGGLSIIMVGAIISEP